MGDWTHDGWVAWLQTDEAQDDISAGTITDPVGVQALCTLVKGKGKNGGKAAGKTKQPFTGNCWTCDKPGHQSWECPSKPVKGSGKGQSTKGKGKGWNKGKGRSVNESEETAFMLSTVGMITEHPPRWLHQCSHDHSRGQVEFSVWKCNCRVVPAHCSMSSSDDVMEAGEVTQSTYDPDESEHVGKAVARLDAKEDLDTHTHVFDIRNKISQSSSEKQWAQTQSHTLAKPSVASISGPSHVFTIRFTLSGDHNDSHK